MQESNTKKSHKHTHMKHIAERKKQKLEKGILKSTLISTGIVLLSICSPDRIVPLSEYCFDVVTIFLKYTKKPERDCLRKTLYLKQPVTSRP